MNDKTINFEFYIRKATEYHIYRNRDPYVRTEMKDVNYSTKDIAEGAYSYARELYGPVNSGRIG